MTKRACCFMNFEMDETDSIKAVKSGELFLSTGVGTQTITISEFEMHSPAFVVACILHFKFFNLLIRYSSSIGLSPLLTSSTLLLSTSKPYTLLPFSSHKQAKGRPT